MTHRCSTATSSRHDGRPIGCALWHEIDGDAELVVIVTTYRGAGAGTALLDASSSTRGRRDGNGCGSSRRTTTPTRFACTSARDGTGSASTATPSPTRARSSPSSPMPARTASRSATRSSSNIPYEQPQCGVRGGAGRHGGSSRPETGCARGDRGPPLRGWRRRRIRNPRRQLREPGRGRGATEGEGGRCAHMRALVGRHGQVLGSQRLRPARRRQHRQLRGTRRCHESHRRELHRDRRRAQLRPARKRHREMLGFEHSTVSWGTGPRRTPRHPSR